jgi:hypothetical protein
MPSIPYGKSRDFLYFALRNGETASMGKLLEIFRAGKRTAMSGETLDFSEAAIAASAAAYDPAIHEAPLVVGHPKHDAPAYGWVGALSHSAGSLSAEPTQVDPTFQEWVDEGRYKKISASFYSPTSPQNPVPGVYYLRHVGFLGAMPPAVKGMKPIEFADGDEGIVTLDFGDWGDNLNIQLWRSLRDWLVDTAGSEVAERVLPTQKIDWLLEAAMEPPPMPDKPYNYSEKPMALTEQELEAREQAIALRERAAILKEQELQFSEAIDGAIKEGRVLAVEKPAHLKRLKMLAAIPVDSVVDFAEGKADYSPTAEYIAELKARPVVVNFGEISGGDPPEPTNDPVAIAVGIKAEIKAAKEDGENLSFAEAESRYRAKQNGGKN